MCGIAVVHDLLAEGAPPSPERQAIGRAIGDDMLSRLHHRGPDGSGTRQVGPTWLGHTRVASVDRAGGEQPWRAPGGERWVVANGVIYHHRDLRTRLGGSFVSDSDSEIALRVVESLGLDGIHDMRGMYAFCVASRSGDVVLARDPLGVKPLYWARHDDRVLAASELAAFPVDVRPFVEEFPPGHHWTPDTGLQAFVDLRTDPLGIDAVPEPLFVRRQDATDAIRDALVVAVRERTMADVPVGVFLSGGLDSSLVAAILARLAAPGAPVHSFAAGTAGSSDLAAARVVAEHLGLVHHERVYTDDDVVAALPEVVRSIESYEPSLVRSAVPNFLVSELAARDVKVVLTGEGADELFAGYHHFRVMDAEALRDALADGVDTLHHLNLQRCDRVTMAHGLEARVPFLSRDMLALAMRIPMEWKLLGEDGQEQAQEKALLREAFAGWIPDEILWRRKEQFGDGSGTADVMARQAERLVPEADWESLAVPGLPPARSREELGYQRIFADALGGIRADRVLGRFATA
ncbi:MAG: hypothetical protein JWO46_3152 [Nocardioidaceae bacterium]|nr:hypothetical protein [Nocardioidaceae bacterium]